MVDNGYGAVGTAVVGAAGALAGSVAAVKISVGSAAHLSSALNNIPTFQFNSGPDPMLAFIPSFTTVALPGGVNNYILSGLTIIGENNNHQGDKVIAVAGGSNCPAWLCSYSFPAFTTPSYSWTPTYFPITNGGSDEGGSLSRCSSIYGCSSDLNWLTTQYAVGANSFSVNYMGIYRPDIYYPLTQFTLTLPDGDVSGFPNSDFGTNSGPVSLSAGLKNLFMTATVTVSLTPFPDISSSSQAGSLVVGSGIYQFFTITPANNNWDVINVTYTVASTSTSTVDLQLWYGIPAWSHALPVNYPWFSFGMDPTENNPWEGDYTYQWFSFSNTTGIWNPQLGVAKEVQWSMPNQVIVMVTPVGSYCQADMGTTIDFTISASVPTKQASANNPSDCSSWQDCVAGNVDSNRVSLSANGDSNAFSYCLVQADGTTSKCSECDPAHDLNCFGGSCGNYDCKPGQYCHAEPRCDYNGQSGAVNCDPEGDAKFGTCQWKDPNNDIFDSPCQANNPYVPDVNWQQGQPPVVRGFCGMQSYYNSSWWDPANTNLYSTRIRNTLWLGACVNHRCRECVEGSNSYSFGDPSGSWFCADGRWTYGSGSSAALGAAQAGQYTPVTNNISQGNSESGAVLAFIIVIAIIAVFAICLHQRGKSAGGGGTKSVEMTTR